MNIIDDVKLEHLKKEFLEKITDFCNYLRINEKFLSLKNFERRDDTLFFEKTIVGGFHLYIRYSYRYNRLELEIHSKQEVNGNLVRLILIRTKTKMQDVKNEYFNILNEKHILFFINSFEEIVNLTKKNIEEEKEKILEDLNSIL